MWTASLYYDNFHDMKTKGLSKIEQAAVNEFAARLRDHYPKDVDSIKLYGSKVRGTANEESDVDILIIVKKRTPEIDEKTIDLVCDILNEFGVFIETVTLATDTYKDAIDRQYPFAINVEKDSISL